MEKSYFNNKRTKAGLTKSEVANALGVSYDRYTLWDKGELEMPSKYIDKFNELIHRKKGEHEIERLNREMEINKWWETMREKDEDGKYRLNNEVHKYNFRNTREFSKHLGFHASMISYYLSTNKISFDTKDRIYTFLHDELNIQPPLKEVKRKKYTNEQIDRKSELLEWYKTFDFDKYLSENNLTKRDIAFQENMATGTVFNLVNKKFETPTINSLAKIKHFIDNNEYKKSIGLSNDISSKNDIDIEENENIIEEHDDVVEDVCDEVETVEEPKNIETYSNNIDSAIARVEILLAKAKSDVLIYGDILKDLKGIN